MGLDTYRPFAIIARLHEEWICSYQVHRISMAENYDSLDELLVRNELAGELLGASGEARAASATGARWEREVDGLLPRAASNSLLKCRECPL